MSFANKDLMLSVLPRLGIDVAQLVKVCAFRTNICRWPTFCNASCPRFLSYCNACSMLVTLQTGCFANSCGAGGSACDPTQFCYGSEPFVIKDLEDLVTIRAELVQTMRQLDQMAEGLNSSITTAAQADEMEATLRQQLEHIASRRQGLK